jgi:hypothetical protein
VALADLCTLDQLRSFLRVPIAVAGEPELPTDNDATEDDVTMFLAIAAASAAVRNSCNRTFEVTLGSAEDRYFTSYHSREFSALNWVFDPFKSTWQTHQPKVFVDDIADLTGLTVTNRINGAVITIDRGWPWNAPKQDRPYIALEFPVGTILPFEEGALVVNAKWGWAAVPQPIVNATLLQASRFYKRRDAPFGIAGSDAMGNSMRLIRTDPDVAVMVSAYSRIWGAV